MSEQAIRYTETEPIRNKRWIPHREYQLMEERHKNMTQEEKLQEAYFFWNNFSMDGYKEFIEQERALGHDV